MNEPRMGDTATLHVRRRDGEDTGAPTIVLVHGITDSGECWDPVAERFGPQWHLLMPDLRGHGASDLPDGSFGLESLAADLAAVIDDERAQRPADTSGVVVIGHSLGAATAALLARDRPELVRALVLEDPPWFALPRSVRGPANHITWVRELQQHPVDELIARCANDEPGWSDAEIRPWARSKHEVDLHFFESFDDISLDDWRETIGALDIPILLITGDVDEQAIVTPALADEAAATQDQLRVCHLEGTSHSIHRDRLDAYMDAVHTFLAEVA